MFHIFMEQWRTLARLGKVIYRPETGEVVIEGVVLNVERFKKSIRKELETLVSILHNDILLKVSLEDVGVNLCDDLRGMLHVVTEIFIKSKGVAVKQRRDEARGTTQV